MQCHEFIISAAFYTFAVFDKGNFICVFNSGQPMRHHEGGTAAEQVVERLLYIRFRYIIKSGSRFIQYDDLRVAYHGTRNCEALFLPLGQLVAAFAYHMMDTARQGFY